MEGRKTKKPNAGALAWFIRSKGYVSIAEIRRYFNIECEDGTIIEGPLGKVHIGLPEAPARAVQRLWNEGKVGIELSVEFDARVLIGLHGLGSQQHNGERPAQGQHALHARPQGQPQPARPASERPGMPQPAHPAPAV